MNPCLDPFWSLPDLRSAYVLHCMIVEHDCNKSTLTTIDSAPPCETLPRLFSGAWTGNLSVHAPVETHLFKKAYLFWELSKISLNWTELEWRCQKSVHTMSIAQVDITCHIQRSPTCYQVYIYHDSWSIFDTRRRLNCYCNVHLINEYQAHHSSQTASKWKPISLLGLGPLPLLELIHCVQKKTPTHIFFHISMSHV